MRITLEKYSSVIIRKLFMRDINHEYLCLIIIYTLLRHHFRQCPETFQVTFYI